jgi:hypothetical protein
MAPRGAPSPAGPGPRGTPSPRRAPGSSRESEYNDESDDDDGGPTLFGSIVRTAIAGCAVVAIAILVRVALENQRPTTQQPKTVESCQAS